MAKDSDEAADRPWNGDKAGWIEAEKLLDRKIYDQLGLSVQCGCDCRR